MNPIASVSDDFLFGPLPPANIVASLASGLRENAARGLEQLGGAYRMWLPLCRSLNDVAGPDCPATNGACGPLGEPAAPQWWSLNPKATDRLPIEWWMLGAWLQLGLRGRALAQWESLDPTQLCGPSALTVARWLTRLELIDAASEMLGRAFEAGLPVIGSSRQWAMLAWARGDIDRAEACAREACLEEPLDVVPRRLLVTCLIRQGKDVLALQELQRARAYWRADPFFNASTGELLLATGQVREALPFLRRAVEADDQSPTNWNSLVRAHQLLGQPVQAGECAASAVIRGSTHAFAMLLEAHRQTEPVSAAPMPDTALTLEWF